MSISTIAKGLFAGSALAIATLMSVTSADATPVTATANITADNVSVNGADLLSSTQFTFSNLHVGSGNGDFAGLSFPIALSATTLNLANITGFTFSAVGFGSFATSGFTIQSTSSNANTETESIFLSGIFSPDFGGFTPGAASYVLSLTESTINGLTSFSGSGTFASPPIPNRVAEPTTLAIIGTSLAGLGMIRRRKAA
jgi:hypothetical protein